MKHLLRVELEHAILRGRPIRDGARAHSSATASRAFRYMSHAHINPTRIVPAGPQVKFMEDAAR